MTLTEYLNQEDPQRYSMVVLDKSEYIKHCTVKVKDGLYYTHIEIPRIAERYNCSGGYIQVNNGTQLYTPHPKTGEIQGRESVFHLPDNTIY